MLQSRESLLLNSLSVRRFPLLGFGPGRVKLIEQAKERAGWVPWKAHIAASVWSAFGWVCLDVHCKSLTQTLVLACLWAVLHRSFSPLSTSNCPGLSTLPQSELNQSTSLLFPVVAKAGASFMWK